MDTMLRNLSMLTWHEVLKKVKKAVVFIDDQAVECLHWQGGLPSLIKAGALAVKAFSSFESGSEVQKKAVFICCGPVIGGRASIVLRDLITNSQFEHCVLVTSCSPAVELLSWDVAAEVPRDIVSASMAVGSRLEADMLHWMGDKNFTVEVFHIPLFHITITDTLFVTPPFRDVFPSLDLVNKSTDDNKGLLRERVNLAGLAAGLANLVTQLSSGGSHDVFTLGSYSAAVAAQIKANAVLSSITATTGASSRVSLILVDRSLDISSVATHSSESLLDRIRTVLPTLPGHSNDVAVTMTQLCATKVPGLVAPGCLSHCESTEPLDWIVGLRQKDILIRLAAEVANQGAGGAAPTKPLARVTPHSLEKHLVTMFTAGALTLQANSALLQQTIAVTSTLKSPRIASIELAVGIEKLLLQTLAAVGNMGGASGAILQLCQLLSCRHERNLGMDIAVGLLIQLYAMVPSSQMATAELEAQLRSALAVALFEDRDTLPVPLDKLVGPEMTIEETTEVAQNIFRMLHSISQSRQQLLKYKDVLLYKGPHEPMHQYGLLEQLIDDIVDPSRPEMPDLHNSSSAGFKGILKTGFSLFLNTPRLAITHPLDNPTVVVFVVGGIASWEASNTAQRLSSAGANVIVGSTRLLAPPDLLQQLCQTLMSSYQSP